MKSGKILAVAFVALFVLAGVGQAAFIDAYLSVRTGPGTPGPQPQKWVYDLATDTMAKDTGFSGATGIAGIQQLQISPVDGYLLYAAGQDSNDVRIYNAATGASAGTVTGVPVATGLAFKPGDTSGDVYVSEWSDGKVVRIDSEGTVNNFATVPGSTTTALMSFSPDGTLLFVNSRGTNKIEKFNASTGAYIGTFATRTAALAGCFSPDGTKYYSAGSAQSSLSVFDVATGNLLSSTFGSGFAGPNSVVVGPDYNNSGSLDLFVSDYGAAKTYVVDGSTGANISGANGIAALDGYQVSSMYFTVTPEPGTIVLLTTGLFGLLAYAWRKRR